MIRVVVTGSECTGKTTLARALAERYRTSWSGEYARDFVAARGAAPERDDVAAIARGQIATEDAAAAEATGLLIQDTDLLSTIVYARHYFDTRPRWVEAAFVERRGDLYLLAGIDVPWSADGPLRDRGERRQEMHDLFRRELARFELPFVELRGAHPARLAAAARAIDPLLAAARR